MALGAAVNRQLPTAKGALKAAIGAALGMGGPRGFVKRRLHWYENGAWYSALRKNKEFTALLGRYRPFAKDLAQCQSKPHKSPRQTMLFIKKAGNRIGSRPLGVATIARRRFACLCLSKKLHFHFVRNVL